MEFQKITELEPPATCSVCEQRRSDSTTFTYSTKVHKWRSECDQCRKVVVQGILQNRDSTVYL
jgi:hypothetical protein